MSISPPENTCCGAVFLHGTHEHSVPEVYGQIWQIVPWVNRDSNRGKRWCIAARGVSKLPTQASLEN